MDVAKKVGLAVLAVCFMACNQALQTNEGSSDGSSNGPPLGACETRLLDVYKTTYHPFLTQTCNACHAPGGRGKGFFADTNAEASFNVFRSIDFDRLNANATSTGHNPPYTGPQNSATINTIRPQWQQALSELAACSNGAGGGNTNPNDVPIRLRAKAINATATNRNVDWSLTTDLLEPATAPGYHTGATLRITARIATLSTGETSYYFSNPTLIAGTTSALSIRDIQITINGVDIVNSTTYRLVNRMVPVSGTRVLSNGTLVVQMPTAATDTVGFKIKNLSSVTFAPPTLTQLRAANGVFGQNCTACHNATTANGGLNLADYQTMLSTLNIVPFTPDASGIWLRMNDAANPMPRNIGLLPAATTQPVRDWIMDGAPNN
jgi:hypothetical protein